MIRAFVVPILWAPTASFPVLGADAVFFVWRICCIRPRISETCVFAVFASAGDYEEIAHG